jgi:hypothetical protein
VLVDAALAGMVLLVGVVAIAANSGVQRRPDEFAYLCVAGLAALMFLRRRFPVLILLASAGRRRPRAGPGL